MTEEHKPEILEETHSQEQEASQPQADDGGDATEQAAVALPLDWDTVHAGLSALLTQLEEAAAAEDPVAIADDFGHRKEALLHALEQLDDAELDDEQVAEVKRISNRAKSMAGDFAHKLEMRHTAIAENLRLNLERRQAIIAQIRALIDTEERIGPAFRKFRDLQDALKAAGEVEPGEYRDLQTAYSYEVDRFYYTINIYKDLRDLDLQHNLEVRKDLVQQMQALTEEKSIRRREMLVKAIQESWSETGPVPHDKWEEVKAAFYEALHKVYDLIHAHYEQVRNRLDENLETRRQLVLKAQHISTLDIRHPKKWNERTIALQALQAEWRKTGPVAKEHSEAIWQEFRSACDTFFERKKAFFKEWKAAANAAREQKQLLITKAEAWKDSEEWRDATRSLIDLQKEWKEVPNAGPYEKELWERFRGICNDFFERKKAYFGNLEERLAENESAKRAILAEMEAFKPGKDRNADIETLKQFAARWREPGMVPRNSKKELDSAFSKAMDKLYALLKMDRVNKAVTQFDTKLSLMADRPDARQNLQDEKRHLRMLLGKAQTAYTQYQHNMGFIKNPTSDSPLLKDLKHKLARVKDDIDGLTAKIKMIDEALDGLVENPSGKRGKR